MSIEYSNYLYKKYADLCLDKEKYYLLVELGIIPKNLENIYEGDYGGLSAGYTRGSAKVGPYFGKIPYVAASLKESLFLEDWANYSHKNHTCMLVYQNFLVICSEPQMEPLGSKLIPNNILPVVIPLYRIMDISISEGKDYRYKPLYKLDITFDNNQKYSAILFTRVQYKNGYGTDKGTYLQGINWSFETNQICLSHALSYDPGKELYNQNYILNVLQNLVNNALNFSKLENIIENMGCNKRVSKKLLDMIYTNEANLVFTMIDNIEELKKTGIDSQIIEKLEKVLDEKEKTTKKIESLNAHVVKLKSELKDKKKNIKTANFLKKISIKSEINKLEEEINKTNESINTIHISDELIYDTYNSILNLSKHNEYDLTIGDKNKALELYKVCSIRGIESIDTEEEQLLFETIFKSLNITEESNPQKMFEFGKKLYIDNNKNNKKSKKEITLKKIEDEEKYNLEKNRIKIIGKNKYLSEIDTEIKQKEAMMQMMDFGYQTGKLASQAKTTKSDEYILGGMVNGLAGGAAALVTVGDIREKNVQAEIQAQKQRERGVELMTNSLNMKSSLASDSYSLKSQKKAIDSKLCDIDHTDKYFEYLNCKVIGSELNISGYLKIDVEVSFKKEPVIKNMPIVIDGSLEINVLCDDEIVGKAYLNAPGFNNLFTNSIGFNYQKNYSVISLPIKGEFDENTDYSFEIKPINIWMIEK